MNQGKTESARYTTTLDYLYTKLPMFERQGPPGIKKDLTNTLKLCEALQHPERNFLSIHIAGTNGKGSVSHMLASVLKEAGYKTGLYVSPHYKDFRERIRVDGSYIDKKFVVDFVDRHQDLIRDVRPSFFEITVAMAFSYFAAKQVEVAVVETGLGGRLDSTNVITPIVSIITNISYDHQNLLGNTLPEIAGEKAGIIKPGIPVLIGEYQKEVARVFKEKAKVQHSTILFASQKSRVTRLNHADRYEYQSKKGESLPLVMPYHGPYQEKNINTVVQAIDLINRSSQLRINAARLKAGLKNLDHHYPLIGRWQVLQKDPLVIADGAHNIAGLTTFIKEIKRRKFRKVHCVFGTVRDKDYTQVIQLLPKDWIYYFVKADIPRGLDAQELKMTGDELRLTGKFYPSVLAGYRAAKKDVDKREVVVVTGSIFVVGEVI